MHVHKQKHTVSAAVTEALVTSVYGHTNVKPVIPQPKLGRQLRKVSETGKRGSFYWAVVDD